MQFQLSLLWALLLAVLLHVAGFAFLDSRASMDRNKSSVDHSNPAPLTMNLLPAPAPTVSPIPPMTLSADAPLQEVGVETSTTESDQALSIIPLEHEEKISMPEKPIQPHYLKPSELTVKPVLQSDASASQTLVLPDVFPQPVRVHLLINEQGEIDQVVLDPSFLSDQAKQFVIEAFAKTRFLPGKLGDTPVKSDILIEVRLEGVLSPP